MAVETRLHSFPIHPENETRDEGRVALSIAQGRIMEIRFRPDGQ